MKEFEIDCVLNNLARHQSDILRQIPENQIGAYARLVDTLRTTDVSIDADYQRTFSYFYRLRLRPPALKSFYFGLLNDNKNRPDLTFTQVIAAIFEKCSQVHPSFSSKLVATINPNVPVYDSHVLTLLGIRNNWQSKPARVRMERAIEAYSTIESFFAGALCSPTTDGLIKRFDARFPSYAHFSRTKKLDLYLWQGGAFL